MILYRHADPRYPFLWESPEQPAARWNAENDGPVQYFSDTPDGAWAEFLRHEEITDPADLEGVRRAIWAVELTSPPRRRSRLPMKVLTGDQDSYPTCRAEAEALRARGVKGLRAPSAALLPGAARGWNVRGGLRPARKRAGRVYVLFGPRPDLRGWLAALGRPSPRLLDSVRHFGGR